MPNIDLTDIMAEAKEYGYSATKELGGLPEGVSVSQFIADYATVGDMDNYKIIPDPVTASIRKVKATIGPEGARIFLRTALAQGIVNIISSGRLKKLPQRVVHHHVKQLKRIAANVAKDADWFDINNDLFQKDFGLVTLRLYAAAAQLLDIRCGIPRSFVFKGNISSSPKKFLTIMKMGGFKPYIEIHLNNFNLEDFDEEGRNECYRCCADLYPVIPKLRGMIGSSWFYDPALEEISPRLNYLRHIPIKGGAHLMFVNKGGSAINNALSKSNTRRKLFEEGRYMPTNYLLVWGKKAQMKWAERNPGLPV